MGKKEKKEWGIDICNNILIDKIEKGFMKDWVYIKRERFIEEYSKETHTEVCIK